MSQFTKTAITAPRTSTDFGPGFSRLSMYIHTYMYVRQSVHDTCADAIAVTDGPDIWDVRDG